ncbi:MAG: RHS repeat-associated core domain-containing protein [Nitrospinae bacterium]|nr:RHS repeat-associated core domain-containing protein [Nitrospinota bacterium]
MMRSGITYRIITDRLGSPRLVVNVADGSVAQRLDYDEFGNVLQDTQPGFQPFGFAGGLCDRDTGLVHYVAREFDTKAGRWMSRDPILFAGGSMVQSLGTCCCSLGTCC